MKVIVVGAGVIGASIAWHVAKTGADVTVVDGGLPAASLTSFGWINASFFADVHHHALRVASLGAYGRLLDTLPDAPVKMSGALWWEEQGDGLREMQASLERLKYPVEALFRDQAAALEPHVMDIPDTVLRFPSEGAAEVAALAQYLTSNSGARLVRGVRVLGVAQQGGAVTGVDTSIGRMEADRVVIAAGNRAPDILDSVGVALPMLTRPGLLVTTTPVAARITSVLVTPHGEVRQLADGRLLASAVANHQGDNASEVTEKAEDIADRVLDWLDPMIAGPDLEWDSVALAYRPVPRDGLPVIGAVGPSGLHVAVMHSGVTLAAITGEATAAEITGQGGYDAILAPYRPQRFQGS
jgi:glycine/D-amino acid oxidase-like deaminating enzyme